MLRGAALLFGLVATTLLAQEPNKDPDSFDIEPPLLIPNRDSELPPNTKAAPSLGRDVDLVLFATANPSFGGSILRRRAEIYNPTG